MRFFLLLLLLCSNALASAKTKGTWSMSIDGLWVSDSLSEASIVGLELNAQITHRFSPFISSYIDVETLLEVGNIQSTFDKEFEPQKTIILNDARLSWKPNPFLRLHMGAINQRHHGSPILIHNTAFPALQEKIHFMIQSMKISLDFQQAIPTSQTLLSQKLAKESNPTLYTGKILAEYRKKKFHMKARLNYFNFQNLTRGTIRDSRLYGNTVDGTGEDLSFRYKYYGWELGFNLSLALHTQWSIFTGTSFVDNRGAANNNRSQYLFGGAQYKNKILEFQATIKSFHIGADASPAAYTNKYLGHNNRKGYGLTFSGKLEKLKISLHYTNAKIISPNHHQADRTYFSVEVATLPAVLFQ